MLGNDTLRSGHLLLLLLVASSVLLGFNYLNEMYQRIQLQTDMAIVERQTQRAASEGSVIRHKAAQLKIKLEAADQEKKRIQEMHTFQLQQQIAKYENEKQQRLEDIYHKDKEVAELQDRYEKIKVRFDNLHSIMDQFEKNQSKLLEKFATQSTQCMNVISMMSQLCSTGKKIQLLPSVKQKNTLMASQPSNVTKKPRNISVAPSPGGGFTKTQMSLMQAITKMPFLSSGGKQRHLIVGPDVNDLSSEPENTVSPGNYSFNALAPKITAQGPYLSEKVQEKTLGTLQNHSFQYEGNLNKIIKNDINGNSTTRQNIQEKWLLDLHKTNPNKFGTVSYSQHVTENEEIAQKSLRLQLTGSRNLTSKTITNVTQGDGERILNLTLSEATTQETTIGKKTTEETPKVNLENASSLLDVYNTEEKDKDGGIKEEKVKYEEIYLTDTDKENHEKLQTLGTVFID